MDSRRDLLTSTLYIGFQYIYFCLFFGFKNENKCLREQFGVLDKIMPACLDNLELFMLQVKLY